MIIVMQPGASATALETVKEKITQAGLQYHLSEGAVRTIVGVIGDKKAIRQLQVEMLDSVEKTVPITESYKLVRDRKSVV